MQKECRPANRSCAQRIIERCFNEGFRIVWIVCFFGGLMFDCELVSTACYCCKDNVRKDRPCSSTSSFTSAQSDALQ